MTKEQEAQQAQTIAEIRERDLEYQEWAPSYNSEMAADALEDRHELLEIVDSQAQKIAEQAKEIDSLREVVKYDKYANLARIMKRPKDVSVFTHKKAEALQKLHEFDEAAGLGK